MSRTARGVITLFDVADGDDGLPGSPGAPGDPGADGNAGARTAVRYLYRETASDTVPAAPSATITWSTGALSSITSGWSETPPEVDATGTSRPWVSTLVFFQASAATQASTTVDTGTTPSKGFVFDGVVTFTNTGDNGGIAATDGTTSRTLLTPASVGASGTTTINGGRIDTNTLNANRIQTNTLTLSQVTDQSDAGGSIEFTNNLITIKDASSNIRVKIGKLT